MTTNYKLTLRRWLYECNSYYTDNSPQCDNCPIRSHAVCTTMCNCRPDLSDTSYELIERAFNVTDSAEIRHMRDKLEAFCMADGRYCADCPMYGNTECNEYAFIRDGSTLPLLPDRRIEHWYNVIFNHQPDSKETVDHPDHYQQPNGMECIDEMILVFGIDSTMDFCLLNAWKYRYRAGAKNGDEDMMRKASWYIAKYRELKEAKHE